MIWYFINSGFNTGKHNMEFDIDLAENCKANEVFFRLYKWNPYCISLGANQNTDQINISKIEKDNIDLVKRPTGGRAVLHAEEITYSVIYPLKENTSVRDLYSQINSSLKKGLEKFDCKLNKIELEKSQANFRQAYQSKTSRVCFASYAKSELKYNGKKLAGSAQKKIKNSILQHGSILCGSYHKKIIDYLVLDNEEYSTVELEIENKTIDLKSILNYEIDYDKLVTDLVSGFSEYFRIEFDNALQIH